MPSPSFDECRRLFHVPVEEACSRLRISRPTLARVMRANGVSRWPFRLVQATARARRGNSAPSTRRNRHEHGQRLVRSAPARGLSKQELDRAVLRALAEGGAKRKVRSDCDDDDDLGPFDSQLSRFDDGNDDGEPFGSIAPMRTWIPLSTTRRMGLRAPHPRQLSCRQTEDKPEHAATNGTSCNAGGDVLSVEPRTIMMLPLKKGAIRKKTKSKPPALTIRPRKEETFSVPRDESSSGKQSRRAAMQVQARAKHALRRERGRKRKKADRSIQDGVKKNVQRAVEQEEAQVSAPMQPKKQAKRDVSSDPLENFTLGESDFDVGAMQAIKKHSEAKKEALEARGPCADKSMEPGAALAWTSTEKARQLAQDVVWTSALDLDEVDECDVLSLTHGMAPMDDIFAPEEGKHDPLFR